MTEQMELIESFKIFSAGIGGGLGTWLDEEDGHELVLERLLSIDSDPLSKVQFNQLLVLSELPSISDGFFKYYWLEIPDHSWDLSSIDEVKPKWITKCGDSVISLEQLWYGFYRLFVDSLLYFGNIKAGFSSLRSMSYGEIATFFKNKKFDINAIQHRGPALPLKKIAKDDRYLISEMACKSYGSLPGSDTELKKALIDAFEDHLANGGGPITFRDLLDGSYIKEKHTDNQYALKFSADELLDEQVATSEELLEKYGGAAVKFEIARQSALYNTDLYLSVVNDLDVYVATSMRTRDDFRNMATSCEKIFEHELIKPMHLRYFDPTLSAAEGHEDKGLIECLMVKCAKLLVYCAGVKESYGKDAEAAMALSLGKPVIFLCDPGTRSSFYKDVHPLSRLIDFRKCVRSRLAPDR